MDIEAGETPLASSREAEIEKLKADLARLQRQLQAEKADNTGNLREYRKQRESCGNRDNDETSLPIKSVLRLLHLRAEWLTLMQTRTAELAAPNCHKCQGKASLFSAADLRRRASWQRLRSQLFRAKFRLR